MKKMMMIAAVVAVAGFAQAASVSWAATALRGPSGSNSVDPITSNTQLMVALVATSDVGAAATGWQTTGVGAYTYGSLSDLNPLATFTGSQLTVASGQASISGTGSGLNLLTQAWAEANRGADGYVSFYAVIFYNAAGGVTEGNATHYATTQIYNLDLSNIASSGALINMTGVFNQDTWTTVPEPTSMALLALGVAAVGLRRRFRK